MRCLITGCGGFIGSHLAEYLLDHGHQVCGTVRRASGNLDHLRNRMTVVRCDVLSRRSIDRVVRETRPDVVFHLAAQSLPTRSWRAPALTFRVNLLGTLAVLDGVRAAGLDATIEVVGSSAEYAVRRDGAPLGEEDALEPASPYALSKIAEDHLAALYARVHQMRVLRVRPFFVIGPRKVGDACSDFARRIVAIERGRRPILVVGNLETVRDFLDVRDAVGAFWTIAERGEAGACYNVCSGRGHRIGDVLKVFRSLSAAEFEVRQGPERLRPLDEPVKIGDNAKLAALGWQPRIPLEQTLRDILEGWRASPPGR